MLHFLPVNPSQVSIWCLVLIYGVLWIVAILLYMRDVVKWFRKRTGALFDV